jgi:hypothetical protein
MNWHEHLVTAIVAFLGGYGTAMFAQRLSVINAFTGLIEKELSDLVSQPENIGDDLGVDRWHFESRQRVEAYSKLLRRTDYLWQEDFRAALAEYCRHDIDYLRVRKTGLIERLCDVYATAKKLA